MTKPEADDIRHLSNDVLQIAHAALKGEITGYSWQRLISAEIKLRELAGLEMPWEDENHPVARTG